VTHLVEQQRDILTFSLSNGLTIDKEVVEYATRNLLIEERNEFENFLQSMHDGDTVIVSTLSILSDRTEELIKVINCMLSREISLWIAHSKIMINKETNIVEIFPLLNDLREAQKEKTNHIGRPKGSKSNSKFDVYQGEIITLLNKGLSVSAIARELKVSRSSLKDYIESRGIKELVDGAWMEMNESPNARGMDNVLLICPFETEREEKKLKVS
jgi:DNA invertase Pin-like site-specific DNA recombinase